MKYRCKDCKAVYDEKPEYCNCGNNTFEEIAQDFEIQPAQKSYSKNFSDKNEIISWVFFVICLIFALLILFVIPNGKPSEKHIPKQDVETTKEIPDIENIWKEEKHTQSQPAVSSPEPVVIVRKIIRKIEEPVTPVQNEASKSTFPNTVQNTANLTKPVEKIQAPETQNISTQESAQTQDKEEKVSALNDPAVIRYKNILREVLLSKLAVGSISGSGTCIIEFSIDSAGKLINRKFAQYSENKQMNDAIYYMMMSVPRFKTPPAPYNGETIRLKFYINNGSYEISFV